MGYTSLLTKKCMKLLRLKLNNDITDISQTHIGYGIFMKIKKLSTVTVFLILTNKWPLVILFVCPQNTIVNVYVEVPWFVHNILAMNAPHTPSFQSGAMLRATCARQRWFPEIK